LRNAFNDYVTATKPLLGERVSTDAIMQTHYGLYLRWRRLRLGPSGPEALESQSFAKRAQAFSRQDYTDLTLANKELREEWASVKKDENKELFQDTFMGRVMRSVPSIPAVQGWIFGEKIRQWNDVKTHWNNLDPLDPAIVRFFDDYVHDSRAWFKPTGETNERTWIAAETERMKKLEAQDQAYQSWSRKRQQVVQALSEQVKKHPGVPVPPPYIEPPPYELTKRERADLDNYRKTGAVPTETSGREFNSIWGYLRWRTLYRNGKALTNKERLDAFILAQPPKAPPPMDQKGMQNMINIKGLGIQNMFPPGGWR
jgi:hypothetical protein